MTRLLRAELWASPGARNPASTLVAATTIDLDALRRAGRRGPHQRHRPELGLDFVELGLVYEIEVEGDEVYVTFTLTPLRGARSALRSPTRCANTSGSSRACPRFYPEMVFPPPWSPDLASEDAKFALGF